MNDSRRHVVHVTFDMGFGGTEQVICQLIAGATSVEHSVLCIDGGPKAMAEPLLERGVAVHALQRRQGLDFSLVRQMRRHFRSIDADVVHCHQYTPFVYGALATLGTKRRLVFTEHGRFYPDRSSWKRTLVNPWLVRRAHTVTAISAATADALQTYEAIPRDRIRVIYNGIDDAPASAPREALLAELGIADDRCVVGSIGRLDAIKNFPMMMRAFARVLTERPSSHLLIIGDGPERGALAALAGELGIGDHVTLTGFLKAPRRFLPVFDLFLLSSFSEGTSMSLLESMAAGLPSVVTAVGGNPELVVDGQSGRIVDSDDEAAFAAAMAALLGDDDMAARLGRGARSRYEAQFSVAQMTAAYAELYN